MLSEEVARASLDLSDREGNDISSLTVRSVVHLSSDVITSSSGNSDGKGVERDDEGEERGEVVGRGVAVELVAVLDPLSAAAQRASTLLLLVRKILFSTVSSRTFRMLVFKGGINCYVC